MDFSEEVKRKQLESPTSNQRVSSKSVDRLSILPVDLRRHIISFLPMQDAGRTSILSRNWSRICDSLPNLIFDFSCFPGSENKLDRFVAFIDQMVARHDESSIKTFKIKSWVEDESPSRFKNAWITFSVQRNVENLSLMLHIAEPLMLPSCLFNSKSLKNLDLTLYHHILKVPTPSNLPNLKELSLTGVALPDDDSLQILFSSCPALETLSIDSSDLHHQQILDIHASKLQHLWISDSDLSSLNLLSVSESNLKNLKISECLMVSKSEIHIQTPDLTVFLYEANTAQSTNLGSILSVLSVSIFCISLEKPNAGRGNGCITHRIKAIGGVKSLENSVESLYLSESFIEDLYSPNHDLTSRIDTTQFMWQQNLIVHMRPSQQHVQKTIALLKMFPNLCALGIIFCAFDPPPNWPASEIHFQDLDIGESLNCLEYIEIANFEGHEGELVMVQVLLANAKNLDDMKIRLSKRRDQTGRPAMANVERRKSIEEKLCSFKKASPLASVVLPNSFWATSEQYLSEEENF